MARRNVLFMADDSGKNAFGISTDPATAAKQIQDGSIKVTENVDEAQGDVIETFKITVKGDVEDTEGVKSEKVFYESDAQPFGWKRVAGLAEVFAANGAELSDEQVSFIGQALSGDAAGETILMLVGLYNDAERAKAKANEYARIMNLYKPASEEDKAKAKENLVKNYAKAYGVSMESAREALKKLGLA